MDDDARHDGNVTPFVPRETVGDDEFDGELDDLFDLDDEEFLADWAEADAGAVEVLREALPELHELPVPLPDLETAAERIRAGIAERSLPYAYIPGAAGWAPPRRWTMWSCGSGPAAR